tara:strand:- start:306 stop:572 length:267 start_codon:yes stop_codon:yes gene_type:complete
MSKEKLINEIILNSLQNVNKLLSKNKRIKGKKFKIKDNNSFDSLNYVTFLVEVNKRYKLKFKKDPKLFNQEVFKNSEELCLFLSKLKK